MSYGSSSPISSDLGMLDYGISSLILSSASGSATVNNSSYKASSSSESTMVHFTTDSNQATSSSSVAFWQESRTALLFLYGSAVLIIVGTVGNLIAIITLQSRLFKSSSISFLLSALALSDVFVLNTGLMNRWIFYLSGVAIRTLSRFGCKVHLLLTYYSHHLASWTLVLLTCDRTISVMAPLHCKRLCSKKRIVSAWLAIAVVLFAGNIHFFFSFDLQRNSTAGNNNSSVVGVTFQCIEADDWHEFITGPWTWIDACLGDLIPFGIVICGNIIIVVHLVRSSRMRSEQINIGGGKNNVGKISSTTAMLIAVSAIFFVCNAPSDLYFIGYGYGLFKDETLEQDAVSDLFFAAISLLYYGNNAVEFVLYFASGRKFRSAFVDMFGCRRVRSATRSREAGTMSMATMSEHSI